MIYIVCATSIEATPLIEAYSLHKTFHTPLSVYTNDSMRLVITGVGPDNAHMAAGFLMGAFDITPYDICINVGIAAALDTIPLGSVVLAHTVTTDNKRPIYMHTPFEHDYKPVALFSSSVPLKSPVDTKSCVDMESYYLVQHLQKVFKLSRIVVLKVISDHFKPDTITKTYVKVLMHKVVKVFDEQLIPFCYTIDNTHNTHVTTYIDTLCAALNPTKAECDKLHDGVWYYYLRFHALPNLPKSQASTQKKERKQAVHMMLEILHAHSAYSNV